MPSFRFASSRLSTSRDVVSDGFMPEKYVNFLGVSLRQIPLYPPYLLTEI